MMTKLRKATRITVSLPDDEHAALTAIAEENDVSLSWLARKAIAEFLDRHEGGGSQLVLGRSLKAEGGGR